MARDVGTGSPACLLGRGRTTTGGAACEPRSRCGCCSERSTPGGAAVVMKWCNCGRSSPGSVSCMVGSRHRHTRQTYPVAAKQYVRGLHPAAHRRRLHKSDAVKKRCERTRYCAASGADLRTAATLRRSERKAPQGKNHSRRRCTLPDDHHHRGRIGSGAVPSRASYRAGPHRPPRRRSWRAPSSDNAAPCAARRGEGAQAQPPSRRPCRGTAGWGH